MEALRQNSREVAPRSLDLIYGDDGMCIAAWGPLLIAVWWREATVRDLEGLRAAQRTLIEEHGMVSTLEVLRHPLSLTVGDAVREVETQRVRDFGACTLASAIVVEETGLRANFFRSVVTGIYLNARTQTQYRVVDSVRDGVEWVVSIPGTELRMRGEVEALCAAVRDLADRHV